jgi:nitrate reductase gamma subunit
MMETLLTLARGPLLYLAFALLAVGTLRQIGLTAAELVRAYRLAGDQAIPFGQLFRRSLGWIVPINALRGTRIGYTVASVLFHAGVLVAPLFLAGHVALVEKGIGLSWPALPGLLADALTLVALVGLFTLLIIRLASRASRFLSGFQDWFLLVLVIVPLLTGYLVAHPLQNPLPFTPTYLVHLLSAELLLALIPFTKLAHAILFPLTRISWELGWHFVPGGGERVRLALGKEGEGV